MAVPTVRHMRMLKRAGRYLISAPSLVWRWYRQRWPGQIFTKSDTDWAGCPITRRSTTGVSAQFGRHLWYTASSGQVPVSLSSAESETYGLTKTCSRAIGTRNLAADLGFGRHGPLRLIVGTDSSSALAISQRRGTGKIRHLEAGCLWIQDVVRLKRIDEIIKILGAKNCADLMTKGVTREDLAKHLASMCLVVSNERAAELPKATSVQRAAQG